jgi:hypothetical protein
MKNKARTTMTALAQTKKCSTIWYFAEGRHVNAKSNAGMGIHRMVFRTTGNLVSPTSSLFSG